MWEIIFEWEKKSEQDICIINQIQNEWKHIKNTRKTIILLKVFIFPFTGPPPTIVFDCFIYLLFFLLSNFS